MSQATNWGLLTAAPATRIEQTNRINAADDALLTGHLGASRPTYLTSTKPGEWWKDVSSTIREKYYWDGTQDVLLGTLNPTTGAWKPATVPVDAGGTGSTTASDARTALGVAYASSAEMEAASSTAKVVSPGLQHAHPGHPKACGYINRTTGSPVLSSPSYGISSVSDVAAGQTLVNFTTNFSSTAYVPIVTTVGGINVVSTVSSLNNGSVQVNQYNSVTGVAYDTTPFTIMVLGDQ